MQSAFDGSVEADSGDLVHWFIGSLVH
jgi:hypothetical protein